MYPQQLENQISFECIVNNHGKMISSICRRMIRDEETVEDAAQEVWLEIVKSLPTYRGEAKLSTWIYTIASRVVMEYAKQEKIYSTRFLKGIFHGEDLNIPTYVDYDKSLWIKEMCDKCLTGILHCLDNETRLAYILRDMAELPYEEIAKVFEKEEPAIRKMISRARKKLNYFLKDECILYNPQAKCKCRMNKLVREIDLPGAYERLRKTVLHINVYRESEKILPGKNYWDKLLN